MRFFFSFFFGGGDRIHNSQASESLRGRNRTGHRCRENELKTILKIVRKQKKNLVGFVVQELSTSGEGGNKMDCKVDLSRFY